MKLVHLVGFIAKKFITMHGHMNVKKVPYIDFLPHATKIQTNKFNNRILVNIISQICEHVTGGYSLGYYFARHVLNSVGF